MRASHVDLDVAGMANMWKVRLPCFYRSRMRIYDEHVRRYHRSKYLETTEVAAQSSHQAEQATTLVILWGKFHTVCIKCPPLFDRDNGSKVIGLGILWFLVNGSDTIAEDGWHTQNCILWFLVNLPFLPTPPLFCPPPSIDNHHKIAAFLLRHVRTISPPPFVDSLESWSNYLLI
jgi:hypothetical protein